MDHHVDDGSRIHGGVAVMIEVVATTVPCSRCGGTGNELLSMYRQCSACGGYGRVHVDIPPSEESVGA